jgi:hypothetical protein
MWSVASIEGQAGKTSLIALSEGLEERERELRRVEQPLDQRRDRLLNLDTVMILTGPMTVLPRSIRHRRPSRHCAPQITKHATMDPEPYCLQQPRTKLLSVARR